MADGKAEICAYLQMREEIMNFAIHKKIEKRHLRKGLNTENCYPYSTLNSVHNYKS